MIAWLNVVFALQGEFGLVLAAGWNAAPFIIHFSYPARTGV